MDIIVCVYAGLCVFVWGSGVVVGVSGCVCVGWVGGVDVSVGCVGVDVGGCGCVVVCVWGGGGCMHVCGRDGRYPLLNSS